MGRVLGSLYRFQDYIDIDTGRTQYPLLFCCVCLKQGGLCTVLHKLTPWRHLNHVKNALQLRKSMFWFQQWFGQAFVGQLA